MFNAKWFQRRVTDSAQRISKQIADRAIDRGLCLRATDNATMIMLALWSVLMGERKVGLVAIERACGDRFDLVRALDRMLEHKTSELPIAYDLEHELDCENRLHHIAVPKAALPYDGWDSEDLLNPLLDQAEYEAKELGHNYLGSEHLVLAIVNLADPSLKTLLEEHGVAYEKVREAIIGLLSPP